MKSEQIISPELPEVSQLIDFNNNIAGAGIKPFVLAQAPVSSLTISVPSKVQEKIIDQILAQSAGVGLGVLISLAGAIYLAHVLGVGKFIGKCLEQVESGTQSLKALTEVLGKITEDLKDNHTQYTQDHEDILEEISEVKEILKTDILNHLKDIERKLTK